MNTITGIVKYNTRAFIPESSEDDLCICPECLGAFRGDCQTCKMSASFSYSNNRATGNRKPRAQ